MANIPSKPVVFLNHFLVVLAVALFFSEFASYLYNKELLFISMKHWAFFIFSSALLVLSLDKKNIKTKLAKPFFKWLLFLLLVTLIWGWFSIAIMGDFPEKGLEQFKNYILASVYLFSFALLLSSESAFILARKLAIGVVLLSISINLIDFLSLDAAQFSPIPGRAAGLYRDPNNSAIVLSFAFILTIDLIRPSLKFAYTLALFLGIIVTQSRGGIIVFSFISIFHLFNKTYSSKSILLFGTSFIAIGIGIGLSLFDLYQADFLKIFHSTDSIFERYNDLFAMETNSLEKDTRVTIFHHYLDLWREKPILGHGLGAAYFNEFNEGNHYVSSHNQFLNMMVDFGITGAIVILTFVSSLLFYKRIFLYYKEALLFVFVFLLFAFTSHNLFDHYSLLFIYMMFGRLFQYKYEHQHPMIQFRLLNINRKVIVT